MKLEYIAEGLPEGPLIRLYDFSTEEVIELHKAITSLASGNLDRIELDQLAYIESIDDCRLALFCQAWDQAVVRCTGVNAFECGLKSGTWDNVAGLIEPFIDGHGGFQWLVSDPGVAALLISNSGTW